MDKRRSIAPVTNGAVPSIATMTLPGISVAEVAPAGEVAPTPRPTRPCHTQRMDQAALVAEVGAMLEGLQVCDPALQARMDDHGITTACVATCTIHHAAALEATEARQQAIAVERQTVGDLNAAVVQARTSIMTLRQVARTVFNSQAAAVALGLNDEMSRATALFVNEARRTLTAAQQPPYSAVLATVAYGPARLQEMVTEVEAVETAHTTRLVAQRRAVEATEVRDQAMLRLGRAAHQVRLQVVAILRHHPELPRPVGFA